MSSDLVSLGVLVVSAAGRVRDLLRQGAVLASLPLEFEEAETASKAVTLFDRGGFDLVLLDSVGDAGQASVIQVARAGAKHPLIILLGSSATGAGADALAAKPRDVEEARGLLDGLVRAMLPARVLIVDDSPTMRKIVRKIIGASRFKLHAEEVDNGMAGLAHVRSGGFDLVFLDYNMPGLDGLATLVELKRGNPDVAVVFMTSAPEESVAERALQAGAAAFLKKPFYPADVDAVMYRRCGLMPLQNPGA